MKDKIYILIIIVLVILSGYLYFSNRDALDNKPFETSLNPEPGFLMSDNLTCSIKKSSDKKEIGSVISFIGLKSDNPKMLSGSTGGTSPLTKLFESDDTITLGLVASGTGSTDIFVINKKTGEFARTSSGILGGVYSFASKGTCK